MIGLGAKSMGPGEPFFSSPSSYRGHLITQSPSRDVKWGLIKGRETDTFARLPLYDVKQMNWIQPTIPDLSVV